MKGIFGGTLIALMSTSAMAGVAPVPVSEPGTLGLIAGGVLAAIAVARLRK